MTVAPAKPPTAALPVKADWKTKSADVAAGLHKQTGVDPDYITRMLPSPGNGCCTWSHLKMLKLLFSS